MSPPLLGLLRVETRGTHTSLEQKLDLMNRKFSLADYARLLEGYARVYARLEPWLEIALGNAPFREAIDYGARKKGAKIFSDRAAVAERLSENGETAPDRIVEIEFSLSDEIRDGANLAAALGVLYVMEGSTLGGRVLVKHFQAELPTLTSTSGLTFFEGYGEETGNRWRAFTEAFREASAQFGPAETATAIRAANATFRFFESSLVSAL